MILLQYGQKVDLFRRHQAIDSARLAPIASLRLPPRCERSYITMCFLRLSVRGKLSSVPPEAIEHQPACALG